MSLIKTISLAQYYPLTQDLVVSDLGAYKLLDRAFVAKYLEVAAEMDEPESIFMAALFTYKLDEHYQLTATYKTSVQHMVFKQDVGSYKRYMESTPEFKAQLEAGYKSVYEIMINEEQRSILEQSLLQFIHAGPTPHNMEEAEMMHDMFQSLPKDTADDTIVTGRTMQGFCL